LYDATTLRPHLQKNIQKVLFLSGFGRFFLRVVTSHLAAAGAILVSIAVRVYLPGRLHTHKICFRPFELEKQEH
jgi:hypothetical protein